MDFDSGGAGWCGLLLADATPGKGPISRARLRRVALICLAVTGVLGIAALAFRSTLGPVGFWLAGIPLAVLVGAVVGRMIAAGRPRT